MLPLAFSECTSANQFHALLATSHVSCTCCKGSGWRCPTLLDWSEPKTRKQLVSWLHVIYWLTCWIVPLLPLLHSLLFMLHGCLQIHNNVPYYRFAAAYFLMRRAQPTSSTQCTCGYVPAALHAGNKPFNITSQMTKLNFKRFLSLVHAPNYILLQKQMQILAFVFFDLSTKYDCHQVYFPSHFFHTSYFSLYFFHIFFIFLISYRGHSVYLVWGFQE